MRNASRFSFLFAACFVPLSLSLVTACSDSVTRGPRGLAVSENRLDTQGCVDDVASATAAPAAAEVYFSMPRVDSPEQLRCRTVASGTEPPSGRLVLALWQHGARAVDTAVTHELADVTGLSVGATPSERALWQRGPNDNVGVSALQLRERGFGLFVNSGGTGVQTTGDILPAVAHFDFPAGRAPRPFAKPASELAYAFDATLPVADAWGTGVPYAASVFRFKDVHEGHQGREVWFSMVFFDPRGSPGDALLIDDCEKCSGYPILITTHESGRRFGHPAPGAATFSKVPWGTSRHFDFRVDATELATALAEAKTKYKLDDLALSPDPADYALIHFNMNPEVSAPPGAGGGRIGMSARDVTLARYERAPTTTPPSTGPTASPPSRVVINAANGSAVGELQVFFKTAASNRFDEQKSKRVPFPTGGGNHDVVIDFASHPDWHGTLTGLRIDPFDSSAPTACFNVDTVRLVDAAGRDAKSWTFDGAAVTPTAPFFGWTFSGIDRLWSDGRFWGGCQAGGDPHFDIELSVPLSP